MLIGNRRIDKYSPPLVVAEIGINHEGCLKKAKQMVDDAVKVGCECVKFQFHSVSDEMIPNSVIPGNATESIWNIISRCSLTLEDEYELKRYVDSKNVIYLSTPFSREAANKLYEMGVVAFKIGSGECNNYPLVEYVCKFGKPIILSTGMNDIPSIRKSVDIIEKYKLDYALLHCTSLYPTPYKHVRLGALEELTNNFPEAIIGLSDHSLGVYTCLGAVSLGAKILEKHFTSDKSWPGPDIPISLDPLELKELIIGSRAVYEACGGKKEILREEKPTIDFAYASVVAVKDIDNGSTFTEENVWVKRPGTGQIPAEKLNELFGKVSTRKIFKNEQIEWKDFR